MGPSEQQMRQPGPVRDLWALAAVRERFRAGELLNQWLEAEPGADKDTVRTARLAALELQRAAKPALGADGFPAHMLDAEDRINVLRAIGAPSALRFLERTPPYDRTEAETLLAELLSGEFAAADTQDRDRLAALAEVAPLAVAAGAPVQVSAVAVRQRLETLDFLNLVGGPDLKRFVGRVDQLAQLHSIWSSREMSLVRVTAPGGVGKSMLIGRFVADALEMPEARPTAVFHFDFDRRDLQDARPATVVAEMLRQAPRWVAPDKNEFVRGLAASTQIDLDEDSYGQSRGSESFGSLLDYRIAGLVDVLVPDGDFRVMIVADSAEQVFGFNDEAANSPWRVALDLANAMRNAADHTGRTSQVMLIYAARSFPHGWEPPGLAATDISLAVLTEPEAMVYLRAEAARANAIVSEQILAEVIGAVGRSPLALRLAARLLASEDARTDPKRWIDTVRNDPERIQATLHDRILRRLRNPNLKKLAHPGLLLRRLTPDIVAKVLAGPCRLDLSKITPKQLIVESAREGQLFVRDPSDPDPTAVWHRPDVRALMLPDLDATIDGKLAGAVNRAAVEYYAPHGDEVSRAEELYHRLRLDQPPSELTSRWSDAVGEQLKRALDEFPTRARDFVRSRLRAASLTEVESRLDPSSPRPPMDDQPLAELRLVIRRELQSGAAPLDTLVRYNVDTLDGPLGDVYAEALATSGQISKLLIEVRAMRNRHAAAPGAVRAAILATAGGLLEGQGKLGEALAYWEEARMPQPQRDEEAALTELGGIVGWLRTRRKLRLLQGRRAELENLFAHMEERSRPLASRPVLLRELLAEAGDLFIEPYTRDIFAYQALLAVLLRAGEAFPSVLVDGERLSLLSDWLDLGSLASSPEMLGDLATKLAYSENSEIRHRLVWVLRDEVEWTLVRALSRPLYRRPEADVQVARPSQRSA
jgi:hypothetical protein